MLITSIDIEITFKDEGQSTPLVVTNGTAPASGKATAVTNISLKKYDPSSDNDSFGIILNETYGNADAALADFDYTYTIHTYSAAAAAAAKQAALGFNSD